MYRSVSLCLSSFDEFVSVVVLCCSSTYILLILRVTLVVVVLASTLFVPYPTLPASLSKLTYNYMPGPQAGRGAHPDPRNAERAEGFKGNVNDGPHELDVIMGSRTSSRTSE